MNEKCLPGQRCNFQVNLKDDKSVDFCWPYFRGNFVILDMITLAGKRNWPAGGGGGGGNFALK